MKYVAGNRALRLIALAAAARRGVRAAAMMMLAPRWSIRSWHLDVVASESP
jgi:hypothetical protein